MAKVSRTNCEGTYRVKKTSRIVGKRYDTEKIGTPVFFTGMVASGVTSLFWLWAMRDFIHVGWSYVVAVFGAAAVGVIGVMVWSMEEDEYETVYKYTKVK